VGDSDVWEIACSPPEKAIGLFYKWGFQLEMIRGSKKDQLRAFSEEGEMVSEMNPVIKSVA
jgi:hypothetical protein